MGTADAAFPGHAVAETSLISLWYPVDWLPLGVERDDCFGMVGRPAQLVSGSTDASTRQGMDAADH